MLVWVDGACSGNPGPGAWSVCCDGATTSGSDNLTTNNRMELTAAIMALEKFGPTSKITIKTDSKYVHDGITQWIKAWKLRGWTTGKKRNPVKNQDLWHRLDELNAAHKPKWSWVRREENLVADLTAKAAIPRMGFG